MSRTRPGEGPRRWRLGSNGRPGGPHVAVVPGEEAPLLPVDLPDSLRGLAREQVAMRQLAEALALPAGAVELYPFAPSGRKAPFARVLAVDAGQAARWRGALQPGCLALLPDYLALPCVPGVWTVETGGGDGVAVRLGLEDGFAAEPEMAARLLRRSGTPRAVLRLGPPEPAVDEVLAGLGVPVHADVAVLAKSGAGKPLRWSPASGGLDLRTPPAALYQRLGAGLARWRWPTLAAAAALAAFLGTLVLETRELRAAAERDAALVRALVREHFVPEGPILNVRAQVQAAAGAAATPQAAARAAPPLIQLQRAAPVLTRDGVTVQAAEYRADTGLVTAVAAADFAGLDALVDDLRGAGFLVEVLDSRSAVSGGVAARLRLQAGPS